MVIIKLNIDVIVAVTYSWGTIYKMSFTTTKTYRPFTLSLILILNFMSFLCFAEEKKDVKVVEVEKVALQNITQTVRLIGTIQAKRSTTLIAKTIGTLDYISHPGQEIQKGDLIATLENVDLEKTYALSASAEKNARDQYNSILELENSKLAKKQDVEDRRNQWIEAQKAFRAAKIEYDKTRFIAPFNGIVGVFKMRKGVQVEVGNPIVSFFDPRELIVEFEIPTPILKRLEMTNESSSLKIPSVVIDGKKMKVPHIQRMVDADTHMSPANVDFSCDDCVIGSNIAVDLIVASRKDVLVIPYSAMFLREGKTYVYLVKENHTKLCLVTLGIREKDKVEVISGISAGDFVIIRGQDRLSPDMEVKIFEPPVIEKKPTTL